MATLLLVAAAVAITAAAPRALAAARRLRRGRHVECDRCWKQLPVRRAVTIANTTPTPDQVPGLGGSAMVAHFHKRCAKAEGIE